MVQVSELTILGASVPYGICRDEKENLWVAAKGGLFKLSSDGKGLVFAEKNNNPQQVAAFCTIHALGEEVVHCYAEQRAPISHISVRGLDGKARRSLCFDGKIASTTLGKGPLKGRLFFSFTRQDQRESSILFTSFDNLENQTRLSHSSQWAYQHLLLSTDESTLIVTCAEIPVRPDSPQKIQLLDAVSGEELLSFSQAGRGDGEIFWPRQPAAVPERPDLVALMDKTGRIQAFRLSDGVCIGVMGSIPPYLGNGLLITSSTEALITCAGFVKGPEGEEVGAVISDWLERIPIDCLSPP